ncbi:MAG: hypothetical protein Q7S37_03310 [bacterium]|nr:hypothetical protein [bacterium]
MATVPLVGPNGIAIACDVESEEVTVLVKATHQVPGVSAFKVGITLSGGNEGLKRKVGRIKAITNKPIVYDHQKAGTDIPQMGVKFAKMLKAAGVDEVILFPLAGPTTQIAWTEACREAGLEVLVGAHMTHAQFLVCEGGYIADDAPERIFRLAVGLGVRNFVVPGNKVEFVKKYFDLIDGLVPRGRFFRLWAPGFIDQLGVISETAKVAGPYFTPIIGSGVYEKAKGILASPRQMALNAQEMTRQLIQRG